ncbi:electron transport complex subunit RsxG [Thalassomonas sp. M1454]|uniref:electron transport complex subunit RsxG n=1 Tax=Thalassomonas sp. M1454 TaxID=2594477 RepID=UPI00117EFA76|nr:electron transport complex subunit RsxG [Thalassomonas sp. M1454]TRX56346.1 electron transport complex subunit RsxG [Thalassomonas sp. M1454]
MKVAVQNNAKVLALFAIACTALVSLVSWFTKDTIMRQQQQQLLNTLYEVIPAMSLNNDLYHDCQIIQGNDYLGNTEQQTAYIARMDNIPVAVAITSTAPDGYNGKINLMVALNVDGSVSGVRVLKHQETPGLGDKIETRKNDWIYSFDNKTVESVNDLRWAVKKDGGMFDQFTGATITPRAVVKAVKNTALFFNENKDDILAAPTSTCGESND